MLIFFYVLFMSTGLPGIPVVPVLAQSSDQQEQKRGVDNVYDGVNARPVLYHEYGKEDCQPSAQISPDGNCEGWQNFATNGCASFCQVCKSLAPHGNSYDMFSRARQTPTNHISHHL